MIKELPITLTHWTHFRNNYKAYKVVEDDGRIHYEFDDAIIHYNPNRDAGFIDKNGERWFYGYGETRFIK